MADATRKTKARRSILADVHQSSAMLLGEAARAARRTLTMEAGHLLDRLAAITRSYRKLAETFLEAPADVPSNLAAEVEIAEQLMAQNHFLKEFFPTEFLRTEELKERCQQLEMLIDAQDLATSGAEVIDSSEFDGRKIWTPGDPL